LEEAGDTKRDSLDGDVVPEPVAKAPAPNAFFGSVKPQTQAGEDLVLNICS